MSFLAGRLAASEGAFFKEASKSAIAVLKTKLDKGVNAVQTPKSAVDSGAASSVTATQLHADVLPEVLRHSVPVVVTRAELVAAVAESSPASTSLAAVANKAAQGLKEIPSPNPSGHQIPVCVPPTALGPRKWNIEEQTVEVVPSTANAARTDTRDSSVSREAVEGLLSIAKAFFVATTLVFGGSTLAMGLMASQLQLKSGEDFRSKGKELMQPRIQNLQRQFEPLKIWAQHLSANARTNDARTNRG